MSTAKAPAAPSDRICEKLITGVGVCRPNTDFAVSHNSRLSLNTLT